MPQALIVMRWDARVGTETLAAYPADAELQDKTLMQIVSQHEYTGSAGFSTLMAGAINIASYYTGSDRAIYLILVLGTDEEPDTYEEGMLEAANQVVLNAETNLEKMLPVIFQRLSLFPKLTDEQRLGSIYNSNLKRMIINRLREDAIVSKSELGIWIKDQYKEAFLNVDNIVNDLIKRGICKITSIKGHAVDLLVLVHDLMILRIPPEYLIKDPVDRHLPDSLKSAYLTEVKNFFKTYKPSDEDNIKIVEEVLLDGAVYEVLKLLREAIVTRNDLEKLKKKGVDNVDRVLKILWNQKMIAVLKDDKKIEYYCLVSDIHVGKFFPRYMIDIVRDRYASKMQHTNLLVKVLDLLREEYSLNLKDVKQEKAKSKDKAASKA